MVGLFVEKENAELGLSHASTPKKPSCTKDRESVPATPDGLEDPCISSGTFILPIQFSTPFLQNKQANLFNSTKLKE